MPRRGRPRRAIALRGVTTAVLGCVLIVLLGPIAAVDAGFDCPAARSRSDGWLQLPEPAAFASSGVSDYASSPARPSLLLATDGVVIARSVDGGCAWTPVLAQESVVLAGVDVLVTGVVDLHVAAPASGSARFYVLAEVAVAGLRRTVVLVSDDEGKAWEERAVGLPVLSRAARLTTSPLAPAVAYLSLVDTAVGGAVIYGTSDAGRTWSRRTTVVAAGSVPAEIVGDPSAAGVLHGWGPVGVSTSRDGGVAFANPTLDRPVADVAVSRVAGGSRLVAADSRAPALHRSDDSGRTWRTVALPMTPTSVATAPVADVVVAAGEGDVVVMIGSALFDVSPGGRPARDVSVSVSPSGLRLLARSGELLLRRDLVPRGRTRDVTSALPRIDLRAADVVYAETPTLSPAQADVVLAPGQSLDLRYTLELPAAPTPLDVFFLVDTTGSMGSVIAGLRRDLQQIVDDLAEAGISAQFGVGEFKDYPMSPYGSSADVPYRLLRRVGPVNRGLVEAIEALQASGGGDIPESAFTGLFQAATGQGDGPSVPAGRGAGFRPGSLRVVVNVTDARFHSESDYPGPGLAETVAALRRTGVRQVGLSVGGGGRDDLEDVAVATRAFAPADGLDCDGDGDGDLEGGDPLVCNVDDPDPLLPVTNPVDGVRGPAAVRMAPAIVGLLRSVRDEAAVELQVQRDRIARIVGPARVERVDAKQDRVLRFVVRYSCPRIGLSADVDVPLRAVSREAVIARASATVRCGPPEIGRDELPPRSAASLAAALVLLPPPPPPPAPVPQNQPQAQSNPQNQPQAQPQVGAAAARQNEAQVAVVDVTDDGESSQSLAMSARPRSGDDGALAALGLAAAMVCGTATALAVRRRTAAAPVWASLRR